MRLRGKTDDPPRRKLDKERTLAARTRHAEGVKRLALYFGTREASEGLKVRRRAAGHGPTGAGAFTRKHWTRADRRKATKAQRRARRKNRAA